MLEDIIKSKIVTFIGIGLVIIFVILLINNRPKMAKLREEERRINEKIEEFESQSEEIEKQKLYLQSDAYRERQARITLNYKKPGENVVFVYRTSESVEAEPTPIANEPKIWQKWWKRLIGKE